MTTIFFLKFRVFSVSFLRTPFFQTQRILALCYSAPNKIIYLERLKKLVFFTSVNLKFGGTLLKKAKISLLLCHCGQREREREREKERERVIDIKTK